jgi:hypothetical protein
MTDIQVLQSSVLVYEQGVLMRTASASYRVKGHASVDMISTYWYFPQGATARNGPGPPHSRGFMVSLSQTRHTQ